MQPEPFVKDQSMGYVVNQLGRLFANALQARLTPHGLAVAQFAVLLELWEQDDVTQKWLVERANVEQATLATTLNRMERDGLIKRAKDHQDKRARRITLTDKAKALETAAKAAAKSVNAKALQGCTLEERQILLAAMAKLKVNLLQPSQSQDNDSPETQSKAV